VDPAEHARAALEFYVSVANLTSAYWGVYLIAAALIIGYTVAAKTRPSLRLRSALTIGFLLFSIANLSVLVSKHSLLAAAAAEVVVAVGNVKDRWPESKELRDKTDTVCSGLRNTFIPVDCLQAPSGRTAFWFHISLDLVVLIAIWHDVRRKRLPSEMREDHARHFRP
jgi:hypothetical protein